MSEKKDDSLELFMQVTREYKRFVDYFAGIKERVENYTREDEYISLNTRLMLLRKYSSSGDIDLKSITKKAGRRFPEHKEEFNTICDIYNSIDADYESILPDGTAHGLNEVIKDVMYSRYLHFDREKIGYINQSEDELIYDAIQRYVASLERCVMDIYGLLFSCMGDKDQVKEEKKRSHIIFLGDKSSATQSVTASPY